ncbi:MAG: cytochrome c biogenesis protein CcdA [Candidatus Baltobacteraceae bacterium]
MDFIQGAFARAAFGSSWAPAAAFAAGISTCFGPCVAPRFVAVVALSGGAAGSARLRRVAAFVVGLMSSSIAIALSVSLLVHLARNSAYIYVVLSLGLGAFGFRMLLAEPEKVCKHRIIRGKPSIGAALLLGGAFGLVLSPCCTPVIVALAAVSAGAFSPLFTAIVLASFALGHALPLVAASFGADKISDIFSRPQVRGPLETICGALMVALALYYAVLA